VPEKGLRSRRNKERKSASCEEKGTTPERRGWLQKGSSEKSMKRGLQNTPSTEPLERGKPGRKNKKSEKS